MQHSHWQTALSTAITDPKELLELLHLDLALLPAAQQAAKLFPLRVPRGFVARMQKRDVSDPLLRQVLPLHLEFDEIEGYEKDPLQENKVNPLPGLLHKFQGRVLLTVTGACAINCRYCFRREFPYQQNNPGTAGWEKVLAYIAADSAISEVILSGGDPLVAGDTFLAKLVEKLAAIAHVKILRIHSRLPIVLPERMTVEFLEWFTATRLQPVLVVHCNHPNEVDDNVLAALQKMRQQGVTLLNQAVLLKGVNDSVAILTQLSQKLFSAGVLPYYLHLLDKTRGTAHFDIDEASAGKLLAGMMAQLPGYLVPKLVREVPGAASKIPVTIYEKLGILQSY